MVANSVRIDSKTLSKNEKKVLFEHISELRKWINTYLQIVLLIQKKIFLMKMNMLINPKKNLLKNLKNSKENKL